MKKRKLLSVVIALVLALTLGVMFVSAQSVTNSATPASNENDTLLELTSLLDRSPYEYVTRIDALKIILKVTSSYNEASVYSGSCPFLDVSEENAPFVAFAFDNGYIKGIGNNVFNENGYATLEEAVVIALRVMGYNEEIPFYESDILGLYRAVAIDFYPIFLTYAQLSNLTWNMLDVCPSNSDVTYGEALCENGYVDGGIYSSFKESLDGCYSYGNPPKIDTDAYYDSNTTSAPETSTPETSAPATSAPDDTTTPPSTSDPSIDTDPGWGPIIKPPKS